VVSRWENRWRVTFLRSPGRSALEGHWNLLNPRTGNHSSPTRASETLLESGRKHQPKFSDDLQLPLRKWFGAIPPRKTEEEWCSPGGALGPVRWLASAALGPWDCSHRIVTGLVFRTLVDGAVWSDHRPLWRTRFFGEGRTGRPRLRGSKTVGGAGVSCCGGVAVPRSTVAVRALPFSPSSAFDSTNSPT